MSSSTNTNKIYRYRGKIVSAKVFYQRQKQRESALQLRERRAVTKNCASGNDIEVNTYSPLPIQGRRIVDLNTLVMHLQCQHCGSDLSLKAIENEECRGLASLFSVRCQVCLAVRTVPTSDYSIYTHKAGPQKLYDINSKATLGSLHAGMGITHMNGFLSCLNVPIMHKTLYKRHERLVGPAIESIAKGSCLEAVIKEKNATVNNIDNILHMLPKGLDENFNLQSSGSVKELAQEPTNEDSVDNQHVRLMVSYDMGWSKRGTGRNYDSLNGFGALIGSQTGEILDYGTRNRKCRLCDIGHEKQDHDCRLNFTGSAKAMEGDLAAALATRSETLSACNTDVGIVIGDDDSSTIASIRKQSSKQVLKLSDVNHVTKGLTKQLHILKLEHKELTQDAIQWLRVCFSYALQQNIGDSDKISTILKQIPLHAFNDHSTCSEWCRAFEEKENYDHRRVPGGFKSPRLLTALITLFTKLSENCDKFAHGTSSQANESLNASMASKAPKARCYSLSESADFRFAAAVAQKNLGENYIGAVWTTLNLSPKSRHTAEYQNRLKEASERRYKISKTREFKLRRNLLKKKRGSLRHRKELKEGPTSQSKMSILENNVMRDDMEMETFSAIDLDFGLPSEIVYFDLETSGLASTAEILQIGLRGNDTSFGVYVTPTKSISVTASNVHNLTFIHGELLLHGKAVHSVSLVEALKTVLNFLKTIGKPCVLVAHNGLFDNAHLIRAITSTGLIKAFGKVVKGFVDTLPLFRKLLNRRNNCSLAFLADEANIETTGAHDAVTDVCILQKLIHHHHISSDQLLSCMISLEISLAKQELNKNMRGVLKSLCPLENVISPLMLKKMASTGISFDILIDTSANEGLEGILTLLCSPIDGKPRVTKCQRIIDKVISFLQAIFC